MAGNLRYSKVGARRAPIAVVGLVAAMLMPATALAISARPSAR